MEKINLKDKFNDIISYGYVILALSPLILIVMAMNDKASKNENEPKQEQIIDANPKLLDASTYLIE